MRPGRATRKRVAEVDLRRAGATGAGVRNEGMFYRALVRPWLFRLDPEEAHLGVMRRLAGWRVGRGLVRSWLRVDDPRLAVEVLGMRLANPVGLAAGLDKH